VRVRVDFLDKDEEPDFEKLQQIHRNAQACSVLLSSLEKDEFDRVNGLEKTKDIWDTLQRAHEGTKPMKKAKRQLIKWQLDRFVMLDDKDPQEMYNQLRKLVNKMRAYGSKRWGVTGGWLIGCYEPMPLRIQPWYPWFNKILPSRRWLRMMYLVKSSIMKCLLKRPNMSKTYPKESSLQRNKTLLSKLQRIARARKL
jgi:hypothetical protein